MATEYRDHHGNLLTPNSKAARRIKAKRDARKTSRAKKTRLSVPASSPPLIQHNEIIDTAQARSTENDDVAKVRLERTLQAPAQRGLPLEVKRRLVVLFAQFHGLSSIRDIIRAEFGLLLNDFTIANYDPARPACRIGRRLKELYHAARTSYINDTTSVAIAHQSHRLRVLETLVDKATTAREFAVAMKGLEQAAKEMGGVLTNQSKVIHDGRVEHRHLSVDDARAELALRLGAMIDCGQLQALPAPTPSQGADIVQSSE